MSNFTAFAEAHVSYVSGRDEITCEYIRKIDWAMACEFVMKTKTCQQKSVVNYLKLIFCDLPASTTSFILLGIFFVLLAAIAYMFLVSMAAFYCVHNSIAISHFIGLSENNTGTIILSSLNSLLDFMALSLDNDYSDRDTQVNFKYGNAVVMNTLYAGIIILLYPFTIHFPYLVRNELCMFGIVLYVGWRLTNFRTVPAWVAIILILFWIGFVSFILINEYLSRQKFKDSNRTLPQHLKPFKIKFNVNDKSSIPDSDGSANYELFEQFLRDVNPLKDSELHNNNIWKKWFFKIGVI